MQTEDDRVAKVAGTAEAPAWHDVPTRPGWWFKCARTFGRLAEGQVWRISKPELFPAEVPFLWYGPVPEPTK